MSYVEIEGSTLFNKFNDGFNLELDSIPFKTN